MAGELGEKYLLGDIPRKGGNSSEFSGTAVFKTDKLAGYLDNEETRALSILRGDLRTSFMSVRDSAGFIGVNIRMKKSKINVDIAKDRLIINIDVVLDGELTGVASGIVYEQKEYEGFLETQLSNAINSQIMNMLLKSQAWGTDVADVAGLGCCRPHFFVWALAYKK